MTKGIEVLEGQRTLIPVVSPLQLKSPNLLHRGGEEKAKDLHAEKKKKKEKKKPVAVPSARHRPGIHECSDY